MCGVSDMPKIARETNEQDQMLNAARDTEATTEVPEYTVIDMDFPTTNMLL